MTDSDSPFVLSSPLYSVDGPRFSFPFLLFRVRPTTRRIKSDVPATSRQRRRSGWGMGFLKSSEKTEEKQRMPVSFFSQNNKNNNICRPVLAKKEILWVLLEDLSSPPFFPSFFFFYVPAASRETWLNSSFLVDLLVRPFLREGEKTMTIKYPLPSLVFVL